MKQALGNYSKYRGQDAKGKWHVGTLYIINKKYYIQEYGIRHEVLKDTVEEIKF